MTKRCGIAAMGGRDTPTSLRWMPCTLAPGHRGCCLHDPVLHAADAREARTWTRTEVLAFGERVRLATIEATDTCDDLSIGGRPDVEPIDLSKLLDEPTS